MIDTKTFNNPDASDDTLLQCWLHTVPSDVTFCNICKNAVRCRSMAIKSLENKLRGYKNDKV